MLLNKKHIKELTEYLENGYKVIYNGYISNRIKNENFVKEQKIDAATKEAAIFTLKKGGAQLYVIDQKKNIEPKKRKQAQKRGLDIFYTYLRKAQEHSDLAKEVLPEEKQSDKVSLYAAKNEYILKALRRGKKIGASIFFDPKEYVIYFELDKGQVSFHTFEEEDVLSEYCVVGIHEWNGRTNSKAIINSYFE